ncbi:MAG: antibiotic biosynthesis monooxygenase [Acidimicrobiia bacterium]
MTTGGIATTPEPPYYAVIFTSQHSGVARAEYQSVSELMEQLAAEQPGFLGVESAREAIGITVSYWRDEESIRAWRHHVEHTVARERGRTEWYTRFALRVARVERATTFSSPE